MGESKDIKEITMPDPALMADLSQPIVLKRGEQPLAVLMSIEEYEHYQTILGQQAQISALEARRLADRAVFGDLVGCALSSDEPIWVPTPKPHWRIPYRFFDGTLVAIVNVDAHTALVSLTEEERSALLEKTKRLAAGADVSS